MVDPAVVTHEVPLIVAFEHDLRSRLVVDARDELADQAIDAVIASARTDKIGDGKVWVTNVETLARIRTGERGRDAV